MCLFVELVGFYTRTKKEKENKNNWGTHLHTHFENIALIKYFIFSQKISITMDLKALVFFFCVNIVNYIYLYWNMSLSRQLLCYKLTWFYFILFIYLLEKMDKAHLLKQKRTQRASFPNRKKQGSNITLDVVQLLKQKETKNKDTWGKRLPQALNRK